MSDESKDSNRNVSEAINAVSGLAKAIPIYQDAVQPAAKEIGKALGTIAKTVNVALAPISVLVWGYDKIKDFVDTDVAEKLENVAIEDIVTPPPHIAGPALESLKYTGSIDELKELYANLIASSMDSKTTSEVHPSFVEIIKQLSSDEAKILTAFISEDQEPIISIRNNRKDNTGGRDVYRHFSVLGEKTECSNLELIPNYLNNLSRLGIIEIPENYALLGENTYTHLETHPTVLSIVDSISQQNDRVSKIKKETIKVTALGRQFIDTCVQDHRDLI